MTNAHVIPGEVIDLLTLKDGMPPDVTVALMKTGSMEVIRMVLPAGKQVRPHQVAGEITVQCLKGRIVFQVEEEGRTLEPGAWLYLSGSQSHALKAETDAVLLVTILLPERE